MLPTRSTLIENSTRSLCGMSMGALAESRFVLWLGSHVVSHLMGFYPSSGISGYCGILVLLHQGSCAGALKFLKAVPLTAGFADILEKNGKANFCFQVVTLTSATIVGTMTSDVASSLFGTAALTLRQGMLIGLVTGSSQFLFSWSVAQVKAQMTLKKKALLEKKLEALTAKITELNKQIADLEPQRAKPKQKVEGIKDSITELEKNLNAEQSYLETLKNTFSEQLKELPKLETSLELLKSKSNEFLKANVHADGVIDTLISESQCDICAQERKKDINKDIQKLNLQIQKNNQTILDTDEEIEKAKQRKNLIQTEIALFLEQQNKVTSFKQDLETKNSELLKAEMDLKSLSSLFEKLKADLLAAENQQNLMK